MTDPSTQLNIKIHLLHSFLLPADLLVRHHVVTVVIATFRRCVLPSSSVVTQPTLRHIPEDLPNLNYCLLEGSTYRPSKWNFTSIVNESKSDGRWMDSFCYNSAALPPPTLLRWPDSVPLLLFSDVKPAIKRFQDVEGIKKNLTAEINAVHLDTVDDYFWNF